MTNEPRPCPCESGLDSVWILDARGIPLCRACAKCRAARLSTFRPEILTDPNYQCDEPIEEDC